MTQLKKQKHNFGKISESHFQGQARFNSTFTIEYLLNQPLLLFQTRCNDKDNCNNDPGDFSGTGSGGTGAAFVTVPGRKNPEE